MEALETLQVFSSLSNTTTESVNYLKDALLVPPINPSTHDI